MTPNVMFKPFASRHLQWPCCMSVDARGANFEIGITPLVADWPCQLPLKRFRDVQCLPEVTGDCKVVASSPQLRFLRRSSSQTSWWRWGGVPNHESWTALFPLFSRIDDHRQVLFLFRFFVIQMVSNGLALVCQAMPSTANFVMSPMMHGCNPLLCWWSWVQHKNIDLIFYNSFSFYFLVFAWKWKENMSPLTTSFLACL